ncbi:MAG: transposase [Planctomycetes bacterium]|nr:transposase [Planctomycetota bacterium]
MNQCIYILTKSGLDKPLHFRCYLSCHPCYQYEAIVTNADDNETRKAIFNSYNSDCQVENFIKELNYEFSIDKVNSQEFTTNSAFMNIKCIAYNVVQCFRQFILKDVWKTSSFKTIKNYLIKIPCNVFRYGKGIRVSLPSSFAFKDVFQVSKDSLFQFGRGFL